ncbi:MAG TPA: AAA family ATPase [Vicinamibacterales bacterium]
MSRPDPQPAGPPLDREGRLARLTRTFTPAIPVSQDSVFAGRREQLQQIVDAISQPGVHVVIFGEPGVGKTSLANILSSRLASEQRTVVAPRVTCERGDDFTSLWRRIFADIRVARERAVIGFGARRREEQASLDESMPETVTTGDVKDALTRVGRSCVLVVIVDEFDRLGDPEVRGAFADTIKVLSDHAVPATLILVGVADTVDGLIAEHRSVERALVQVRMPRMSAPELEHIVTRGLALLGMSIDTGALEHISALSQGLPHYTHLLALHATRVAIEAGEDRVTVPHVLEAIGRALEKAQHSIRSAYAHAVASRQTPNRYPDVLLACALAQKDDFGFFSAADARAALQLVAPGLRDARIERQLKRFAEAPEPILQTQDGPWGRRHRFANPLMQPYVILQGVVQGTVTKEMLNVNAD